MRKAELSRICQHHPNSNSKTMLARRSLARAVAQPVSFGTAPINARNMATLREIELRLKSVRNIEKITKVWHVYGNRKEGG
jgi:F-type H+-transporting ATPase subunit gamma